VPWLALLIRLQANRVQIQITVLIPNSKSEIFCETNTAAADIRDENKKNRKFFIMI
jgi:hypothetical protein